MFHSLSFISSLRLGLISTLLGVQELKDQGLMHIWSGVNHQLAPQVSPSSSHLWPLLGSMAPR